MKLNNAFKIIRSGLFLALASLLLTNSMTAIDVTFTTTSKKPVSILIKEDVIVGETDQKTGQTHGARKSLRTTIEIDNKHSKTVTPKSNIFTFSAETQDKKAKSKEYFIYLPGIDKSISKAEIKVNVRWRMITFQSTIPIEKNQTFYTM